MELKKIFAATAISLFVVVLQAAPVIAGTTTSSIIVSNGNGSSNGILPGPGVLGLVAAVIVGTIFLARRGK